MQGFKRLSCVMALLGFAATAYGTPVPVIFYSQNFNSLTQNSPLAGQDNWVGLVAGASTITVKSNALELASSSTTGTQVKQTFATAYLPATNEIDIHFLMTPVTSLGNTSFYLWLGNAAGTEFRMRFGDNWSKVSGSGAGATTSDQENFTNAPGPSAIGIINDIDLKILTSGAQATAQLFVNGVPNTIGGFNVPGNVDMLTGLKSIKMELLGGAGPSGQTMTIDDFQVGTVPEPMTLAMLVLGAIPMVMRRRRAA